MRECFVCGIEGDKSVLYEGIGKEGIVSVCRKCYFKNKIPLVTKKQVSLDEAPRESVRARLSRMAGLKEEGVGKHKIRTNLEDVSLRDIVEKNFQENIQEVKTENVEDLVSNFHWVVMRKRRQKKMTQKEFAEAIFEPVSAVEYLEKGILPLEYVKFIRKVEKVLEIRLLKESKKVFDPSNLSEESKVESDLTIDDLKRASEKRGFLGLFRRKSDKEKEEMERDFEKFSEEIGERAEPGEIGAEEEFEKVIKQAFESEPVKVKNEREKKKEFPKKDLTQKEIDDLLFNRR